MAAETTEAAAWRANLERVFDVDDFLKWLAIAATIQHWDTYGAMTHNYYLYSNPATSRFTWISWDHNQVLASAAPVDANNGADQARQNPARAGIGGAGGPNRATSFDKAEVTAEWPLIRYVLDQPEYKARYNGFLRDTVSLFDIQQLENKIDRFAARRTLHIGPDATETEFAAAVQSLKASIESRAEALKTYVDAL